MIKKDPDVVLTVRDAARAQAGLTGAPGTLRVIDEKTVYLRMPATFMEPETLLMVLRNLMRQAYDREQAGGAAQQPAAGAAAGAPSTQAAPWRGGCSIRPDRTEAAARRGNRGKGRWSSRQAAGRRRFAEAHFNDDDEAVPRLGIQTEARPPGVPRAAATDRACGTPAC